MKTLKLIAVGLLLSTMTFAQKGVEDGSTYGHGEDSVRCIYSLVLYGDAVKQKNYKDAYEPWTIVFNECPKAKKTTLYTDGVRIVKALYAADKDVAKREEYFNMLMKIYDQREKYYGTNKNYPSTYIKGIKAVDILTYKDGNLEAQKEADALLEVALTGTPNTIQSAFVMKYLLTKVDLMKANVVTAEDVVNSYIKASNVVASMQKVATDKNRELIEDCKVQVEQIFAQSGAADCETIAKIFGVKLEENKEDLDWLKRVNKLLANGDCTESELFYATSEYLHKIEPEASSARGIARMYIKQNDMEKALAFYNEAVSLETEDELKAKYYYEISIVNLSNGNYSAAKSAAVSAANLKANWGEPYILLGKIYAAGAKNIGTKDYEKKAGYWAAVDKFAKAKSVDSSENIQKEANELIRQYSQYFPNKEDLFFEGIQTGTSYFVGGYISENTTVRAK